MECFLVVNVDHGVGRVRCRQPHGEKASDEGEEEQSRQQHVQTECGVKIKLVGSGVHFFHGHRLLNLLLRISQTFFSIESLTDRAIRMVQKRRLSSVLVYSRLITRVQAYAVITGTLWVDYVALEPTTISIRHFVCHDGATIPD